MNAPASQQGFTLIQISILLIVASLVLVNILPSTRSAVSANRDSVVKLNTVMTALRQYEASHASLPCPADASQPIGGTNYGVAAANSGTTTNCGGGTPAANYTDSTNKVAIGMVPVRALGLSNDYALDGYGRDITYAVDTNATTCFTGTLAGQISVYDNGASNNTITALISHGADGHGAWIPLTGSTGSAVRLNAGSTDTDEHMVNAHGLLAGGFPADYASINTLVTNAESVSSTFVNKMATATFDDLVVYKSNLWNINSAPVASAAFVPSVVPPSNGSYYTGQTLTFTVTYGSAVTVTGTPELTLSIPQSNGTTATKYATYISVTGNTMTFTYSVVAADYAPSGISMSSPIVLNSGTISVGGNAACLSFTPPNLSAVLLNPVVVYVVDTGNYRVQKFSTSGTWLGSIGGTSSACTACMCTSGACPNTQGTGNGQFYGPWGVAADSSGNIWVSDSDPGYGRMQKFDQNGNYLLTYNGTGSPWGTDGLYGPSGISFDTAGNVWFVDNGRAGVVEISSSGTYISQFGSFGTGHQQFEYPEGISFDSSNNFYVENQGAINAVRKYTPPSTYDLQFAPTTTPPGPFAKPENVIATTSGNLWVADVQNSYYVLQKYTNTGTYLMGAGPAGNYVFYGGEVLSTEEAGMAIDPSGDLWVNDYYDNRVVEYDSCGRYLFSFGTAGSGNGQLNGPAGIAIYPNTPGPDGACITGTTPPSNGAYTTGQTLTFTVSYSTAVTVTGTPQLVLTIGSNTRYANYVSGSGTTTLTFTYTIQSSDTATGITTSNSINLNGGSISSGGVSANNNFTPYSLGGITINSTAFMLVADSGGNRVEELSLTGTFIQQFGCTASSACTAGSGNGQLSSPLDAAVDGSGNVWITDYNNNRVQEFSSTGTWLGSLGGTSSACTACLCTSGTCPTTSCYGNGQFNGPFGIAVDSSGNVWVADYNNLRTQEFDKNGNFIGVLGQIGNESTMAYLAFSPSQNLYITEPGNDAVDLKISPQSQILEEIGWNQYLFDSTQYPELANYSESVPISYGIVVDACSNVWIADTNNNGLLEVDYAGNYVSYFAETGGIQGVAVANNGNIYVANNTGNTLAGCGKSSVLTE